MPCYKWGNVKKRTSETTPILKNGFIYPLMDTVITFMCKYLCVVEPIKLLFEKLKFPSADPNEGLINSRFAVDVFIIIKWFLVSLFWVLSLTGVFTTIIVWYLLISNVLTHFYHNLWIEELQSDDHISVHRIRRRFSTLMLAISFSIFGFAYLYAVPYHDNFQWDIHGNIFWDSIFYSTANSMTMTYGPVTPLLHTGHVISVIQLGIMFVFFSMLLSGTLPQINSIKKDGNHGLSK